MTVRPRIQLSESKKVESKIGGSTSQTTISIFDDKLVAESACLTQEEIRNLDENQKFASAKSFFHGMTVGSLGFSFNLYFFLFVYYMVVGYFNITSISKVNI